MPSLIPSTEVFLMLLSAFAFYSTWYLVYKNGTLDLMTQVHDQGPHLLPGTKAPLKRVFTGINSIDDQLTGMVLFFWEQVDGSLPNASLFCFMFAGEAVAVWTILYVESQRLSNSWRLVSFAVCWGLAFQVGTFAVFMPLYLAIQLSTSPTVSSRRADDFVVNVPSLLSLPFSLAIGFMIPAVALALPAPSILTYNQKQTWIAVWQVFPIWIEISQQILSFVVSRLFSPELHISRTRQSSKLQKIRALRIAYIFAMVVVGVTRIATFSISLTSKMFPAMFAPEYRGILDPSNVFRTAFTSPSNKLSFVGEGAFQLLQHDEICGSVALLVWSATLLVKKYNESQAFNLQAGLKMLAAGIGLIALVGPCGCATAFMWARDELVFHENVIDDKKSS